MSMTISQVLERLKQASMAADVRYDFAGCIPTRVSSWRGIYADPAIGWSIASFAGTDIVAGTVQELIAALELAISDKEIYVGWKGGSYRFSSRNTLHIDNQGECTNTEIVSIELPRYETGTVIIVTEHERD